MFLRRSLSDMPIFFIYICNHKSHVRFPKFLHTPTCDLTCFENVTFQLEKWIVWHYNVFRNLLLNSFLQRICTENIEFILYQCLTFFCSLVHVNSKAVWWLYLISVVYQTSAVKTLKEALYKYTINPYLMSFCWC